MLFLVVRCNKNGIADNCGIVVADSPKKAAEKLGKEITGEMTQSIHDGGLGAYHLKRQDDRDSSIEPLYILEHKPEWPKF